MIVREPGVRYLTILDRPVMNMVTVWAMYSIITVQFLIQLYVEIFFTLSTAEFKSHFRHSIFYSFKKSSINQLNISLISLML